MGVAHLENGSTAKLPHATCHAAPSRGNSAICAMRQERIAMSITRETIVYDGPGGPFEGMAVRGPAATVLRRGIMLVPNGLGTKEQDFAKAEDVAALGFVVFVADVFGQGKRTTRTDPDAGRYMNVLRADRGLLRDRPHASLH